MSLNRVLCSGVSTNICNPTVLWSKNCRWRGHKRLNQSGWTWEGMGSRSLGCLTWVVRGFPNTSTSPSTRRFHRRCPCCFHHRFHCRVHLCNHHPQSTSRHCLFQQNLLQFASLPFLLFHRRGLHFHQCHLLQQNHNNRYHHRHLHNQHSQNHNA